MNETALAAPSVSSGLPTALDNEARDHRAERRLMHRVEAWTGILVPVGAIFFGLLVFVAAHIGGAPAGAPAAMGAGVGALSGIFFGVWAGVVASVNDIEHVEDTEHAVNPG